MQAKQKVLAEKGVSHHFPITHLVTSEIFETYNGQLGVVMALKGIAFDTATPSDLNQYSALWHQALCQLGEDFCLYSHIVRKRMHIGLKGVFDQPFLRDVDQQYQTQFASANAFTNQLYLTILYKGMHSGRMGKTLHWFSRMGRRAWQEARQAFRQRSLAKIGKAKQHLLSTLQSYGPRVLEGSALMAFLSEGINGLHPVKLHSSHLPLISDGMGGQYYPPGCLGYYLSARRLFFGEAIEIANEGIASRFAAMLSIKSYPSETSCLVLDPLLQLDSEWLSTQSFAVESSQVGQQKLSKQLIRMQNANDPAETQKQQLTICRDQLACGELQLGYHHHSLMLVADDLEALPELCHQAQKAYHDTGVVATVETLGQEPTFWAQVPGNQRYIVRSSLVTSRNFIDMSPLHNYPTGYCDGNHLGSAVTLMETPSRTPVFFNFHSRGSGKKEDLTPGHTTIIGGNGSGKTVFMGFVDSQMSRYGGRSFFFDRDRGLDIYVRASGGRYLILGPDSPDCVALNPFTLPDNAANRSFLVQWLCQLVRQVGEVELPAGMEAQFSECVAYAYESLQPEQRYLSNVLQLLPIDFPRWDRLRKWQHANQQHSGGEWAYLFDQAQDALDVSVSKLGFDFTDLLQQPQTVVTAVTMYLVHRIQCSLDGQRVSLYFDEGWQFLDSPYWQKQLRQDLPTLRKRNAHVVLATQSPESVLNSALSAQFLDNAATQIFFCNPQADYERHYQRFSITPSEFDFLKDTPRSKRLFLYKQGQESIICRLNLTTIPQALMVYSANSASVRLLDQLREELGEDPSVWLPVFYRRYQQFMEQQSCGA